MSAPDQSSHRNRSIRLAVLTSIASKFGTVLLRAVSIPVAIQALKGPDGSEGLEMFGVYVAITVVVAMVDVFGVGIGPALTQRLSKAVTNNDRKTQQQVIATSLLISFGFTAVCMGSFALVIHWLPIATVFGEKFAPFAEVMKPACYLAIIIVAIEFLGILIDRARDGYMETRYNNLWGAGGNIVGAGVLFFGIQFFPNIFFLLLAVNGSVAAAKLGNSIHFFIQRPFLLCWFKNFKKALVKPLLKSGAIFTITYSLSALVELSLLGYLVGRYIGPEAAATCGIFVTIHVSLTGLIQMFTIPAWPALIDARSRGDFEWIRHTAKRLKGISLLFGIAVLTGTALLGPWAIPLWVGEELVVGRFGMTMFALFFAGHIWRHANQILLLGFDQEKWVARVISLEAFCAFTITWILLHEHSRLEFVYAGVAVSIIAITGWIFPARFKTLVGEMDSAPNQIENPESSDSTLPNHVRVNALKINGETFS